MVYTDENIQEQVNQYRKEADSLIQCIQSKTKTTKAPEKLKGAWGQKVDLVKLVFKFEKLATNSKTLLNAVLKLKQSRTEENDVLKACNTSLQEEHGQLENEHNDLSDKYNKVVEYTNILDKLDEHLDDWKTVMVNNVTDGIKNNLDDIIKDTVKKSLPEIVKSTVKETTESSSLKRQWSDLFKTVKDDVKTQAGQTFSTSLTNALKVNQREIIESTKAKQDEDQLERDRRSRNVVLSNVPECRSSDVNERIKDDTARAATLCGVELNQIIRCFRAGKTTSEVAKPRLLIIVLKTPELARELHNYGNGQKLDHDNNIWVNPDLIYSERQANFKARMTRRDKVKAMQPETRSTDFASQNQRRKAK